ncbi:MAG: hypothetical protein R3B89_00255 [Polyangiaceae bacterium]
MGTSTTARGLRALRRAPLVGGFAAAALTLLFTGNAAADTLASGGNSVGKITRVSKGVKELSLETQLVFHSDTNKNGEGDEDDTTTSNLSLVGAPVFRYFLIDNLSLGLHVGGFYKSASSKTGDVEERKVSDVGFLGTLSVSYNVSLGGGMFIAPLLGGGYFAGSREDTTPGTAGGPDTVIRSSLSGGVGRAGLGLVFYPSSRFNLFARPEALMYFGSEKEKDEARPTGAPPVDPDAHSFTTIDAGFTCGASYIF